MSKRYQISWLGYFSITVAIIIMISVYFAVIEPKMNKTQAPTRLITNQTELQDSINSSNPDDRFDSKSSDENTDITTIQEEGTVNTESDPGSDYYYNLGLKAYSEAKYEEAITYYASAIELEPKVPNYYSKKAEAEVQAGKKDQAIATVEAGLAQNPGDEMLATKLEVIRSVVQ